MAQPHQPPAYEPVSCRFTVAPGSYTVLVGTSSAGLGHAATFRAG
ncbi:MAG TPA: hypothetical protein VFV73_27835 [Streptosporangiaceae bacterium]|nr:hypothetical protein [Streptosporangiaceae bacterium]HEX5298924.1 hypothetical protein [Streptosporangiaceae bacterium]